MWVSPSFNSILASAAFLQNDDKQAFTDAPAGGTRLMSHTVHTTGLGASYIHFVSEGKLSSIAPPSEEQRAEAWRFSLFKDNKGWKREAERLKFEEEKIKAILLPQERRKQRQRAEAAFDAFTKIYDSRGPLPTVGIGRLKVFHPPQQGKAMPKEEFYSWLQRKDAEARKVRQVQTMRDKEIEIAVEENVKLRAKKLSEKLGVPAESLLASSSTTPSGSGSRGHSQKEKLVQRRVQELRKAQNPLASPIRLQLPRKSRARSDGRRYVRSSSRISDSRSSESFESIGTSAQPELQALANRLRLPVVTPCASASKALVLEERIAAFNDNSRERTPVIRVALRPPWDSSSTSKSTNSEGDRGTTITLGADGMDETGHVGDEEGEAEVEAAEDDYADDFNTENAGTVRTTSSPDSDDPETGLST